ncbi:MAG: AAA family ATPase [Desulfobacteraceae bacterium]|nr:MAG: AAA family ATPase [Desulfobacteraceae bacterium]
MDSLGGSKLNPSQQRKPEESLNDRLRFEELISGLSATFINLPPEKIGTEIEAGLRRIGEFLDADRCALMRHTAEGEQMGVHYSWISERLDPGQDIFPSRTAKQLLDLLFKGKTFVFRRPDDIPEDWVDLREFVFRAGVKSAIIIPLKVAGRLLGGFTIDSFGVETYWPEELVPRLKFVVDVFANALARKQAGEVLNKTLSELARLKNQFEADCTYLRNEIKLEHNFEEIIGRSYALRNILLEVEKVAPTDATVLILGETGTGKELFARAIHHASSRKDRPMVKVNCAALPSNLIESELFGHVRGAFTGAHCTQAGRFELANMGTLFLDEIAELPLELQPKLLRVIQEGEFERLGNPHSMKVDVRIIAATNRDLEREVQNGRFRKDLWFRLNVFPVTVPPLRERTEDVPVLVNWFVRKFNRKHAKSIKRVSRSTMTALEKYSWPGNVRELENAIERAVVISQNDILTVDLPKTSGVPHECLVTLEEIERAHISRVLQRTKWRVAGPNGAAIILGTHPNTLRARMKKLGINRPWN